MDLGTLFFIALALAVDAFAVALAAGISLGRVNRRQTFRLGFHFGLFQALMTIGGWMAGLTFRAFMQNVDHWAACFILGAVGIHMIVGALKSGPAEERAVDPSRGPTMVMLSVATSIDALAVGLSFSVLHVQVWFPALIIGLVAAFMTAVGMHLGRLVGAGSRLGAKAEIIGGMVLIGIGINILIQHGVFTALPVLPMAISAGH